MKFKLPVHSQSLSHGFAFLCDVYLCKLYCRVLDTCRVMTVHLLPAYLNWSIFTSLTITLFYFSVWELGVAGSEASLLSTLSPIFLGFSIFRDIASSRAGRTILHVLSLTSPLAYLLRSPLHRLLAVSFANIAMCIGWTVEWSATPAAIGYQAIGEYCAPWSFKTPLKSRFDQLRDLDSSSRPCPSTLITRTIQVRPVHSLFRG